MTLLQGCVVVLAFCVGFTKAEVTGGSLVNPKPSVTAEFNVRDFGAIDDGVTINTAAFARAIRAAHNAGGGLVTVSNGTFVTGGILLLSNVFLNVQADAKVLGSFNLTDYPTMNDVMGPVVIGARDATNVGIVGGGVIDGNGMEHFSTSYLRSDDRLVPWNLRRPRLVVFMNSSYVLVRDVTIQNSADWTSHYWMCQNVLIDNVTVLGDWRFPNNDGIDPDCVVNMTIQNSYIDVSDDAICPKTTDPFDARYTCDGLRNLLIQDCMVRSRSSGFKVGSATQQNVSDILMQRVYIWDSNRGIGIQHRDQGHIHDLEFRDIIIDGVSYQPTNWWGVGEPIAISSTSRTTDQAVVGTVGRITFHNITARSENGAFVGSRTQYPIYDINFSEMRFELTLWKPKRADIIYCFSSHDYRPSYEPQIVPSPTNGIWFENVQSSTVSNSSILFKGENPAPWGECIGRQNAQVFSTNVDCSKHEQSHHQQQRQRQPRQQQQQQHTSQEDMVKSAGVMRREEIVSHLSPQ